MLKSRLQHQSSEPHGAAAINWPLETRPLELHANGEEAINPTSLIRPQKLPEVDTATTVAPRSG